MDPIGIDLTTPAVRLEDLLVLLRESAESVATQLTDTVDPTESHRYQLIVSVEQRD
jgi:hypothetical protein